jgi:hypothetical protein
MHAGEVVYQDVHGPGLEVVVVPGALLPGDVYEAWDSGAVPFPAAVPQDLHALSTRTWPSQTWIGMIHFTFVFGM